MYNKVSHAAERVELEPPGQVSLYLSPTLTAGPFCNICLRFHTKLDDKVAPILCHKYTLSCYSVKEMRLSGWMQMIQEGMRYSPALRSAALRCVIKCLCWVTLWSQTCYFTIWWELWPYKFNTSWIAPLIKKVSPHLESYSHFTALRQRRNPQIRFGVSVVISNLHSGVIWLQSSHDLFPTVCLALASCSACWRLVPWRLRTSVHLTWGKAGLSWPNKPSLGTSRQFITHMLSGSSRPQGSTSRPLSNLCSTLLRAHVPVHVVYVVAAEKVLKLWHWYYLSWPQSSWKQVWMSSKTESDG